jgi:hypothetical protein
MSSNAISAASSSGPAWQVDIPGLSQLILSAGSYGLKQLATSGVDIHSIGCLLMIAEYVPASKEFRGTLNRARELQRSERLWMYKVVEIGAGTNFLADQMLKTRAGENALALMSATIPVMDEDSSTCLLSTLFEGTGVTPDNIPGIKQLENIRHNLAPLARKTGFRERVLRHHHWLWQILRGHGPPQNEDPYDAIPVATDIPQIIRKLHKIATAVDEYILIYNGIRGAAWVVTYACSVLGLNVCALNSVGDPIPIAGKYEDAQVVIDLASKESNCQLYLAGTSTDDLIVLQQPEQFNRRGWSIDCSSVNFVDLQHPGLRNSESFLRLSHFVALETMGRVIAWARTFHQDLIFVPPRSGVDIGFKSYTMSVLPILLQRSLEILRTLGFRPGQTSEYDFADANDSNSLRLVGHKSDPVPSLLIDQSGGIDSISKQQYIAKFLSYAREGQYITQGAYEYKKNDCLERLLCYLSNRPQSCFERPEARKPVPVAPNSTTNYTSPFPFLHESMQVGIEATISIAINFASKLSFSDWNTTFGVMSVRAMSPGERSSRAEESTFEGPISEAIELCVDGIKMIDLETRLWSQDWIALDLDGVVVFRKLSRQYSIHDINGKYLSFCPGRLQYEGTPCSKIRIDRTGIRYRSYEANGVMQNLRMGECLIPPPSTSRSRSAEPNSRKRFEDICAWKTRELCSRLGDTIFVRLEVILSSNSYIVVDSSRAASTLPRVLVTNKCPHGFSKAGLQNGRMRSDLQTPTLGLGVEVSEGLSFGEEPMKRIYYQHTENVPLGQWLACHWKADGITILQNGCCLKCLFERLGNLTLYNRDRLENLCIIAGGEDHGIYSLTMGQRNRSKSSASPNARSDYSQHSGLSSALITGQDLVNEFDVFFRKEWVPLRLAKMAFHIRLYSERDELIMSALRSEDNYRLVQAAFVIEALGRDSPILSKLRPTFLFSRLKITWDELSTYLISTTPTPETVENVYKVMKGFEETLMFNRI